VISGERPAKISP